MSKASDPAAIYPPLIGTGLLLPIPQGPYIARDVTMANFLVGADHEALQHHLDHYINERMPDGEWQYKVLLPSVLITYAHLKGDVYQEDGTKVGLMDENDLCFWVLAAAMKRTALGVYVPNHLVWFVPYIFVDNPFAVVAGREIYGFPKSVASFDGPDDVRDPTFQVDCLTFEPGEADRLGRQKTLLSCHPIEGSDTGVESEVWSDHAAAARALAPHFTGHPEGHVKHHLFDKVFDLMLHFLEPKARLLFLKQHRAAAAIRRAGFQAVVEEPIALTGFSGGGLYPRKYRLELNALPHYPIAEKLGIHSDGGVMEPAIGYWAVVDFSNGDADVIWQWPPLPTT